MATESTRSHTWADLLAMPEDNRLGEILGGRLFITSAQSLRHQQVLIRVAMRLDGEAEAHGGEVMIAPFAVYFSETDVVNPDVIYVAPESVDRFEEGRLVGAPDILVEVSSPEMRQIEVGPKRRLYEANGVPEYWYVDLEADRVEVYRLRDQGYGLPTLYGRGDALESPLLPRLSIAVDGILGLPQE